MSYDDDPSCGCDTELCEFADEGSCQYADHLLGWVTAHIPADYLDI